LTFRFLYNSEFIKEGSMFLLREGRTKILGIIKKLILDKNKLFDPKKKNLSLKLKAN